MQHTEKELTAQDVITKLTHLALHWKTLVPQAYGENYENGREVDVSNILFNQHKFANFQEFKKLIVEQKPRFTHGFVAHLLSYALCRELGPADTPAIDAMTEQALSGKDSLRAVLKAIALSEPFLHKNTLHSFNR